MTAEAPAKRPKTRVVDGNTVTARIAHALSDAFFVYPITPSTPASEYVERLVARGKPNVRAAVPRLEQMQSELGSIAACHGAAHASGVIATTFTSSQGLLLMQPSLIKMAGERRPAVVHVAARALAGATLNIYGDHADVMQLRSTGALLISSANQEECQFNALLAHLAARLLRVPVLHFYDGFDTSHELQAVELLPRAALGAIWREFCAKYGLRDNEGGHFETPEGAIGLVTNDDTHFQVQLALKHEAAGFGAALRELYAFLNARFAALGLPSARAPVEVAAAGAPDAAVEHVVVAMGSATDALARSVAARRARAALVRVNVYRPLDAALLAAALRRFPRARRLTVLDRSLELQGPPALYSDVLAALATQGADLARLALHSGVYGLGGKELRPEDADAVVDGPGKPFFTLNVNDDVGQTHLAAPEREPAGYTQLKIYGVGSEGYVSAADRLARALCGRAQVQKMSRYDAKKSGGLTESDLRVGPPGSRGVVPLRHRVRAADGVLVSRAGLLAARGQILGQLRPGGVLLLLDQPALALPPAQAALVRERGLRLYSFAAAAMARERGLPAGARVNYEAVQALADLLGLGARVSDAPGLARYVSEVRVDELPGGVDAAQFGAQGADMEAYARRMVEQGRGGEIPVSAFRAFAHEPLVRHGTAKLNAHAVSEQVAKFASDKCTECGRCAAVCPHGVIQPVLLTEAEAKGLRTRVGDVKLHRVGKHYYYLNVDERGCTGCSVCVFECPTKALSIGPNAHSESLTDYVNKVMSQKDYAKRLPRVAKTQKAMQFTEQFSSSHSACAGCGQSGYINLLGKVVQGARLHVVQGTGCPLVYLGQLGAQPLAPGAFWTNSLFEDTNEVAFGLQTVLGTPVWAVLGDGAATDINFSGLDFNIQSGRPLRILVLDNNGYANTGGQRSSASLPGTTMRLASAGVGRRPKDLVQLMMVYRHAYIATVTLDDPARAARILREAHGFPGPALVIAYSPCIAHKPEDGMQSVAMMRDATKSGVFPLLTYDPRRPQGERLVLEGEPPPAVTLMREGRISDAQKLEKWVAEKWAELEALSKVM